MTECYPDRFTTVYFSAATGIVKSHRKGPSSKPVGGATSSHRANPSIILGSGFIFIDQPWGRRPEEKPEKLDEDSMKKLKNRFKKK